MPVVGTAGHVDHGKTLLINALTGVDTDRLPEEKRRGMTIDLGFAHFLDSNGRPIGVIDVPGHEQYIRNMVAGAWGLDCALLVVAADDGWMPQTATHARVLSVFGVKRIILVLNKIDLVFLRQLSAVEEDVKRRVEDLFGQPVPVVRVSARTGEGIEALKETILRVLEQEQDRELPKAGLFTNGIEVPSTRNRLNGQFLDEKGTLPVKSQMQPESSEGRHPIGLQLVERLYIDRVFSLKGQGTVVAGSLKRGRIRVNDELLLLPRKVLVRVRRIQSYNRDYEEIVADEGTGAVRVALILHGLSIPPIRGDCLVFGSMDASGKIRGQSRGAFEVQNEVLAVGYLLSSIRAQQEAEIAFGTAHQNVTLYRLNRQRLGERDDTETFNEKKGGEPLRLVLGKRSFLQPGDRFLLIRPGGADIFGWGEVLWVGKSTQKERTRVVRLFQEGESTPTPVEIEEALRGILEERKRASILEEGGALQKGDGKAGSPENAVSLSGRAFKLYQEIRGQGETPWELQPGRGNSVREDIDRLCKGGMIVPLDGSLYLETQVYDSLVKRILAGRLEGGRVSIGEAKEATGLSRKYILPLLNRMERDGWVKRWGDDRIIRRIWIEDPQGKVQGEA